jgi:hypothetical protein
VAKLKYQTIAPLGIAEAEAAIMRNDPAELRVVPVAVSLHAADRAWAEDICIRLAAHADANVRGNAILGFAHLARRFRALERSKVEPLIVQALRDPVDYVRMQAINTADDLAHFLGWPLPPHV